MELKTVIKTDEVKFGSKLILKDGTEVTITGYKNSMLPTIDEIYEFYTDKGTILPEQVEKIIK